MKRGTPETLAALGVFPSAGVHCYSTKHSSPVTVGEECFMLAVSDPDLPRDIPSQVHGC